MDSLGSASQSSVSSKMEQRIKKNLIVSELEICARSFFASHEITEFPEDLKGRLILIDRCEWHECDNLEVQPGKVCTGEFSSKDPNFQSTLDSINSLYKTTWLKEISKGFAKSMSQREMLKQTSEQAASLSARENLKHVDPADLKSKRSEDEGENAPSSQTDSEEEQLGSEESSARAGRSSQRTSSEGSSRKTSSEDDSEDGDFGLLGGWREDAEAPSEVPTWKLAVAAPQDSRSSDEDSSTYSDSEEDVDLTGFPFGQEPSDEWGSDHEEGVASAAPANSEQGLYDPFAWLDEPGALGRAAALRAGSGSEDTNELRGLLGRITGLTSSADRLGLGSLDGSSSSRSSESSEEVDLNAVSAKSEEARRRAEEAERAAEEAARLAEARIKEQTRLEEEARCRAEEEANSWANFAPFRWVGSFFNLLLTPLRWIFG